MCSQCMGFMLPGWALISMGLWFLAGSLFYIYRLLFGSHVRQVYGYHDVENEVGHGICMAAMVTMLMPMVLPIPSLVWGGILGVGALWFFARACTWGRKLPYNKWWWDWAHVGMLLGMALMFVPLHLGPVGFWVQVIFWSWFSFHYVRETVHDVPSRKLLYIGSDLSHLSMGVIMLAMTIWPNAFMPGMVM